MLGVGFGFGFGFGFGLGFGFGVGLGLRLGLGLGSGVGLGLGCRCSKQRGPEPSQPKQALATARASTLSQPARAHPARGLRGGARSAAWREHGPRAQRGRRGWRRREASLTGEDQRREHGVLEA